MIPPTRGRTLVPVVVLAIVAAGGIAAFLLFRASSFTYAGTFSATGSMTTARNWETATLLADGRVLVAGGGSDDTTVLSSAELYDPQSGTFRATGSMTAPRFGNTATLLPDGRVLIAGGLGERNTDFDALASAELYDPQSGTFAETGAMATPRSFATATLLPDGRVLLAGGENNVPQDLSSAELYDPRSGAFKETGAMATSRSGAAATLLPDGSVLVAGGWHSLDTVTGTDTPSAELYDPKSGTFKETGAMATAREWPAATVLADGRVLLAGGRAPGPGVGGLSIAELYYPLSGSFAETGPMATPRVGPTSTLLRDGRVLIVGGGYLSAELYDPQSGTFTAAEAMTTPRSPATATLLADGRVLLAGGWGNAGPTTYLSSADLFR